MIFCEDTFLSAQLRKKVTKNQLTFSQASVSYTHLDVYKRQTQYITGEGGQQGALYGDWHQLWIQIFATLVSIVFSAVITFILYKVVDSWIGIRVSRRVEEEGLDIYEHGESAYN